MARAYSPEARPLSNATLARMQAAFDVSQFCRQDLRFGTRADRGFRATSAWPAWHRSC